MPRLGPLYRRAVLRRPGGPAASSLAVAGVTVDPAHLAEYDRVCGFRLSTALPATFPHVLAFPLAMALMTGPAFPFPLLGLVHIANRIELRRPLTMHDTLSFRVQAEAARPHERGEQIDVVATATVEGAEVWVDRSTYLHRTAGRPATARAGGDGRDGGDLDGDAELPPPSALIRVDRRVGADYAAVSGDRNPIHTNRLLARAFGFPRTIAHGMWTKARCLAALEGRLPDAYTVDVAFKLPIALPATVALRTSGDWRFSLHDAKSAKPHLTGTVTASR
jgi:acyl dehydratase